MKYQPLATELPVKNNKTETLPSHRFFIAHGKHPAFDGCVPWAVISNIAFMTLQYEAPCLSVVKNFN